MMGAVATVARARNRGHDSCAPTKGASSRQSTVTINGSPVMCVGDRFEGHGCKDHGWHQPVIVEGSGLWSIDGQPVAFVGCKCANCPSPNEVSAGDDLVNLEK